MTIGMSWKKIMASFYCCRMPSKVYGLMSTRMKVYHLSKNSRTRFTLLWLKVTYVETAAISPISCIALAMMKIEGPRKVRRNKSMPVWIHPFQSSWVLSQRPSIYMIFRRALYDIQMGAKVQRNSMTKTMRQSFLVCGSCLPSIAIPSVQTWRRRTTVVTMSSNSKNLFQVVYNPWPTEPISGPDSFF